MGVWEMKTAGLTAAAGCGPRCEMGFPDSPHPVVVDLSEGAGLVSLDLKGPTFSVRRLICELLEEGRQQVEGSLGSDRSSGKGKKPGER